MKISRILLVIFFIAALLGSIAGTSYYYIKSVDSMEEQVYNHLKTAAYSRAYHVESFLEEQKEKVLIIADKDILEESLDKANPKLSENDLNHLILELEEILKINEDDFEEIFILNSEVIVLASTDSRHIGIDESQDIELLKESKAYISEVHYSDILNRPVIDVSAKIIDDETGDFIGAVVAVFSLGDLSEVTLKRNGLGETGEVYLIDKDGYMITPSRFLENQLLVQKVDSINSRDCFMEVKDLKWQTGEHIGHEAIVAFLDYRGEKVLGTHVYIPEVNWCLLAEMDEAEILGKQRKMFQKVSLTIIIAILIITILVGFFVGKFIDDAVVLKKKKKSL